MFDEQERCAGLQRQALIRGEAKLAQRQMLALLQMSGDARRLLLIKSGVGLLQSLQRGAALKKLEIAQQDGRQIALCDDAPIHAARDPIPTLDLQLLNRAQVAESFRGLAARLGPVSV